MQPFDIFIIPFEAPESSVSFVNFSGIAMQGTRYWLSSCCSKRLRLILLFALNLVVRVFTSTG